MNNKKLIAVCFYGQTRIYELLNHYYSKWNKNDKYEFHFFASTWNDFSDKSSFDYFTDCEFIDVRTVGTQKAKGNTPLMTYTFQRVNLLKLKYELENNFVYDYIIATRTDVLLDFSGVLDVLDNNINKSHPLQFMATGEIEYRENNNSWYLGSDFVYIGTSLALDLHSSMFKKYYLLQQDINLESGGHTIHATSIIRNGLNFVPISLAHGIIRPHRDLKVVQDNLHLKDVDLIHKVSSEAKKWKWNKEGLLEKDGNKIDFKGFDLE